MARRHLLLACLVGLYCMALGAIAGVLIERIRFDRHRAVVLAQYDALSARLREHLMAFEVSVTRRATPDR
jgi:hypothetical protein